MGRDGAVRCGLPAEVRCRFVMNSSDGPLESVMIRCPSGHCFKGPTEFLTVEKPARAAGPRRVKLPVTGMERGRRWYQRVPGFEVTREFADPARYLALAGEAGQGAVCG
jgi:hypothetical protein